ncbi:hypothetical protein RBSH_02050 [Rhodopirellula baltica SH28]|uniref:Uncharacterized protein n=1 Tax=Rhodopirellula baltica SH28 TaxID=993517 RepID=K5CFD7_RHOBT|nr:hypothetical protein RBSH_02050 [Rhodopirellula baltica SH28]
MVASLNRDATADNMVFTLGLRHTFVGRQRALALVQFFAIQTPPLR